MALPKGLACDLAYKKVTVNQIFPGSVGTDLNPADEPNADFFRELTALITVWYNQ
ncbi:Short-chain dehydrogenase/reductase SDR (fragment) [Xenorhabdus bovienii str. Jollieti]|uniref:Short-chain dehydrogenase/reductase SDR n=1 Tax=Xenorhabdus bovienii (strain SS-2004) TaxID=406818 RepID=D3V5C4_XENBS